MPGILGTAIAGAVVWGFFSAVRIAAPPPPAPVAVRPQITVVRTQEKTADADLFSLEPLFLPTRYNTSVVALPKNVAPQEPGSMAFTYPAKLTIDQSSSGVHVSEPNLVPARDADVLTLGDPPNTVAELGRVDIAVQDFPARLARIEVVDAKTGDAVLAEDVPLQRALVAPATAWDPVVFLVAVDRAGLVGSPIPAGDSLADDPSTASSSDEVENFFRDFLVKNFQLGARLPPGFYSVRVGP